MKKNESYYELFKQNVVWLFSFVSEILILNFDSQKKLQNPLFQFSFNYNYLK